MAKGWTGTLGSVSLDPAWDKVAEDIRAAVRGRLPNPRGNDVGTWGRSTKPPPHCVGRCYPQGAKPGEVLSFGFIGEPGSVRSFTFYYFGPRNRWWPSRAAFARVAAEAGKQGGYVRVTGMPMPSWNGWWKTRPMVAAEPGKLSAKQRQGIVDVVADDFLGLVVAHG